MRYVVPRERDGAPSISMVERHDDDGSILYAPLVDGNFEAERFDEWLAGGGMPAFAPDASATVRAEQIAAECQRRIYAVASRNCQMNMTAWIASGQADESDRSAFEAALAWVQGMRAACAALIAANEPAFADDARWPGCPARVAVLAARF